MDSKDLAKKLWDMANLITGFAVAQSLVVSLAIINNQMGWICDPSAPVISIGALVVITLLYCWALVVCGRLGSKLGESEHRDIWCYLTGGRIAAVLLFNVVLLVVIHGAPEHCPHPTAQPTTYP